MRIITGIARGRRLQTLPGEDTRPTTDKVKEGIFSAIQFDLEGRRVLDLFAGSGQMGLEALSRGAAGAVFVERNPQAVEVVRANIAACRMEAVSRVVRADAAGYLAGCREEFDIIFLDPPYGTGLLQSVLPAAAGRLSSFGMLVCEHRLGEDLPDRAGDAPLARTYRYGKTAVSVYRRHKESV